jgi:cellulose synthase/poly-beta-1,6-N-acetylglucosamine synthase-like glycosyltransferase
MTLPMSAFPCRSNRLAHIRFYSGSSQQKTLRIFFGKSMQTPQPSAVKTVSIILPFFNEAEGIPFFFERLDNVISNISDCRFELICINDGSRDMTFSALETAKKLYPAITIIDP